MAEGTFTIRARRGDLAGALVLLAFALAMAVLAWRMPFGNVASPGPGAIPFGIAVCIALVSIGLMIRALRWRGEEADLVLEIGQRKIWISLVALTVLALLIEPLGYLVSISLFMLVLFRSYSTLSWRNCVGAAVLATLLSWLFFSRLLGVNLPLGVLRLTQGA